MTSFAPLGRVLFWELFLRPLLLLLERPLSLLLCICEPNALASSLGGKRLLWNSPVASACGSQVVCTSQSRCRQFAASLQSATPFPTPSTHVKDDGSYEQGSRCATIGF